MAQCTSARRQRRRRQFRNFPQAFKRRSKLFRRSARVRQQRYRHWVYLTTQRLVRKHFQEDLTRYQQYRRGSMPYPSGDWHKGIKTFLAK